MAMFQPHTPTVYNSPITNTPHHEKGGGLGGILDLATSIGIGAFTGNWAPLIGDVTGAAGGGGEGFGTSKQKPTGGGTGSDLGDLMNPKQDPTQGLADIALHLASETMTPKLGQPTPPGGATSQQMQQQQLGAGAGQQTAQAMQQSEPFMDLMDWW